MKRTMDFLNASILWRWLDAFCRWMGRQWRDSALVRAFVAPMGGRTLSENSIFFTLWSVLRGLFSKLYTGLRLNRLLHGSIFLKSFLWCGAAVVLAPVVPTMVVLALALVAVLSLGASLLGERQRQLSYAPINRVILLYAGVYIVATFTSVTPRGSLFHGLLMVFFILFALVVENNLDSWEKVEGLVLLMVLAGGLVAAIGVWQYVFGITGASSWLDSNMFGGITTRVYSTLDNPNVLAEYLILTIPLGGAALLTAKGNGKRLTMLVCCGLMCLCMVLTFSRGGWLGLLLAGGLFLVLLQPRLLMLAPFALVAMYFVLPDTVIDRFASIGNMKDGSTSYRFSIWMGTINMLKDYWLCGVGPGTNAFNLVYPAYSYNTASAQHGHNLFLQIFCDGGVCAFVIFLLVIFVFSRMICGGLSRAGSWRSRCYLAAVIAGVGGFMVQSMTDYTFYNYRVALLFWVILGIGGALAALSEREERTP